MRRLTSIGIAVFLAPAAFGQVDPAGRSILFIRGADGTGGLGSGSMARRTEHLSDISNTSTNPGNHGFGSLAALLRNDGFVVSQWIESQGTLTIQRLRPHRIVVFGSNNRVYSAAEVAAFVRYFDEGGSSLFISDANWGSNFATAPNSDNQFLSRYGAQVYQDSANGIPVVRRTDAGRFLVPGHATLSGPDGVGGLDDVATYEGEGVSWLEARGAPGVTTTRIVSASGFRVRLNTTNGTTGQLRNAGPNDVGIFTITKGNATIAGHYDRNSFFNPNGTGSNITRRDNAVLARNLFRFLASIPSSVRSVGTGCGRTTRPALALDHADLARASTWTTTAASPNAPVLLLLAPGKSTSLSFPGGCVLQPALASLIPVVAPTTDATGRSVLRLPLPRPHPLSGRGITGQTFVAVTRGPLLGVGELSNGLEATFGFRR